MIEPTLTGALVRARYSVRASGTLWRRDSLGQWLCQCCGIGKAWDELLDPEPVDPEPVK